MLEHILKLVIGILVLLSPVWAWLILSVFIPTATLSSMIVLFAGSGIVVVVGYVLGAMIIDSLK